MVVNNQNLFLVFLFYRFTCARQVQLCEVYAAASAQTNERGLQFVDKQTHAHTHTRKKTTVIAIRYGKENKQEAKICSIDSLRICLFLASVSPATTMNHHSNKANLKFFTFFRFQTQLRFRFRLHRDGTAFLSIRRTSNISNHVALPQFLKQSF